jgi:DNA repair protein RadD
MIKARDYQIEAVDSLYRYFQSGGKNGGPGGNPVVAMPTGTGKSYVIALFCSTALKGAPNTRIIIATHVKELIAQNYAELLEAWPHAPAGVNSAGLKRRDTRDQIIFAGIQSVAKRWAEFGFVHLLIIDEAHLVGPDDKTNYQLFIKGLKSINPNLRVIGLTATPYRLGYGHIADGELFDDVCFDITGLEAFNRLIAEGYLSPLIPKKTMLELEVEGVKKTGGDYNGAALQIAVDKNEVTYAALKEALALAHDRKHWLIFSSGVEHAEHIAEMLRGFGEKCEAVHSKMGSEKRDEAIAKFKRGELRMLVNNNILTTGFNSPWVDCIVCLRPTTSAVLWVQMLGRGTRPFKGNNIDPVPKVNCLALDFAGNIRKLGPINDPVVPRKRGEGNGEAPIKLCEVCNTVNHASARKCICCGTEFPLQVKIKVNAETTDFLKGDLPKVKTFKVEQITYTSHTKVGRPPVLKATYYCGLKLFNDWVCLEHEGFAGRKAKKWWEARSDLPVPATVADALELTDIIPSPTHIEVWLNTADGYPQVLRYCYDGTNFGTESPSDDVPTVASDRGTLTKMPTQKHIDEDIPF